jgi:hypothetical protein
MSKVVATGFTVALSTVRIPSALAQDTCRQGFVWREAFAGDHVCVTQSRVWQGSVRSLDCEKNQIFGSKSVTVPPNQTMDVKFVTPNCGSRDRPSFRPNVVKSSRID